MGSAKVHAFSRVSYVAVDSNHGPADFRRREKYETLAKVETLETLGRVKEMVTARVRNGEKGVRKAGRGFSQDDSGRNCSDRELGEISEESWESELENSPYKVTIDKKRKYSDFNEDRLKNISPRVLDDDCEPGQIREGSECDREGDQLPTIASSRWAGVEDSQSPNLKRMKMALSPLENGLPIANGNGESNVAKVFDGEEETLPNIAVSRWAYMEDYESSDPKRVDDSPKPRLKGSPNPRVNDNSDARVNDSSNPRSRKSTSPSDSEGTKRFKFSSSSSGGTSFSVESQHSSVRSETDGSHRSGESCARDENVFSDDEQYPVDVDHDNGYESVDGSPSNSPASVPPLTMSRRIDMMQGCKSVDEFERLNKINEGTYGIVYRARNKKTGEIVALKKVKMEREREGFPISALREINVLLSLQHPSIVNVKEVVVGSSLDSIFMVMEYMEHDLKGFIEVMKHPFSLSEVKCLMLQLLEGVNYLHDNWILHRDLKTSNLLFNNTGDLKICDFGLARQYGSPLKTYTQLVVTLWYRAPELLLGAKKYSTAVDMWSVGCIMAELIAKEPLFNGKSEIDQIDKIFRMLGTPKEKIWPDFVNLPGAKCKFVKQPYNKLREKFPAASFSGKPTLSDSGFDLLNRLLTYDPDKRITAEEALNHEWFRELPLPKSKTFMPTLPSKSDQDRQSRRLLKSPDPLGQQFGRAQQVIDIHSDKSASLHLKTSTSFGRTLLSSMAIECVA